MIPLRILFSSTPAYGHLLPQLPLLAAARRAGHETAVLTHRSVAGAVGGARLYDVGWSIDRRVDEAQRRLAIDDARTNMSASVVLSFFVDVPMEIAADDALEAARAFRPDVVVADSVDFPGQFAADALGVPYVAHGHGAPIGPLNAVFEDALAEPYGARGVKRSAPIAYLDPWPQVLLRPDDTFPADRIAIRPEPHTEQDPGWRRPSFPGRDGLPVVLVTLGTIVDDAAMLAAVVASVAALDVNVVVAPVAPGAAVEGVDPDQVHQTGFVPMAALQQGVDVVVSSGGAGTVLSTLSAALPLVVLPAGIDKPDNAARASAAGAAVVVDAPEQIGGAVRAVLDDPDPTRGARAVAAEIAAMPAPGAVLDLVLDLL